MKTLHVLWAAVLVCLLCSFTTVLPSQDKKKKAATEEVTFVTSLHCATCAKKIEDKVRFEKGVVDFKTNVDQKTVWFEYNPSKTNKEKLAKAIEKCGYTAEEVKETKDKE